MQQINVFYHLFCKNNFREKFFQAYNKIQNSGLINKVENIFVNCVGDQKQSAIDELKDLPKVHTRTSEDYTSEKSTLDMLWDFCQTSTGYVLYMHSKGTSRMPNENIDAWVHYMEYFCVMQHEKCLKALETYSACGVNFCTQPMKHFSGNFWWATCDFVRGRNKLNALQSSNITDERWYCEFWLLDTPHANVVSLHQSNCDMYATNYKKHLYEHN